MGRIEPASLEQAASIGRELGLPPAMAQRNAYRTLAIHPALVKAVFGQLSALLLRNRLDTRLRELMIMRIGWVTGSAYEWTQHWRVATQAGIPPEDVLAVRDWRASPRLGPADRAVLAAVDDTLATGRIADATWAECIRHVRDPGEQVELVAAIANWGMFSQLLRSLDAPVEDGVMVWPPDGLAPAAPHPGLPRIARDASPPTPRVEPVSIERAEALAAELGMRPSMARLNPFRTLLLNPPLAKAVYDLLTMLLFGDRKLDVRLRELIIMRIAWLTGSEYEWTQHWRFALSVGLPPEDVVAVRDWRRSDRLGPADRAVLAAVDDTLGEGRIADATWAECARHVASDAERVEMVVAIGNWTMFSQLLRSLQIPLEAGTAGWPPDGARPV